MSEPITRRTLLVGLSALGAGALVGCRTGSAEPESTSRSSTTHAPTTTTTTIPVVPPAGDDRWPSIDPVEAGWDPKALAEVVDFVGGRQSRAFLVVLDGRILAEQTWGTPDPFRRDVASAQKSVVAVLAALANAAGELDLDAPVERYIGPGWSFASAVEERKITVHHLLTMTSGLGDDLRRAAAPGAVWDYNNNAYHLLQPVLEAATGTGIEALTRARLWDPIGVSADSVWAPRPGEGANREDPKGRRLWGLTMTVRDMARFGLLVQRRGRWGDEVVVPERELERILRPSQDLNPAYGELWWLNGQDAYQLPKRPRRPGPLIPSGPDDLVSALGAADQKIYVSRSTGLVVTRLGQAAAGPAAGLSEFDDELWKRLMAARS